MALVAYKNLVGPLRVVDDYIYDFSPIVSSLNTSGGYSYWGIRRLADDRFITWGGPYSLFGQKINIGIHTVNPDFTLNSNTANNRWTTPDDTLNSVWDFIGIDRDHFALLCQTRDAANTTTKLAIYRFAIDADQYFSLVDHVDLYSYSNYNGTALPGLTGLWNWNNGFEGFALNGNQLLVYIDFAEAGKASTQQSRHVIMAYQLDVTGGVMGVTGNPVSVAGEYLDKLQGTIYRRFDARTVAHVLTSTDLVTSVTWRNQTYGFTIHSVQATATGPVLAGMQTVEEWITPWMGLTRTSTGFALATQSSVNGSGASIYTWASDGKTFGVVSRHDQADPWPTFTDYYDVAVFPSSGPKASRFWMAYADPYQATIDVTAYDETGAVKDKLQITKDSRDQGVTPSEFGARVERLTDSLGVLAVFGGRNSSGASTSVAAYVIGSPIVNMISSAYDSTRVKWSGAGRSL